MKKKKKITSAVARELELLNQTLEKTGANRIKDQYPKKKRKGVIAFPNLKADIEHREKYPSVGGFDKTPGKRELPSDAKQFPIGNFHKQGLELMYSKSYAAEMNGSKK
jgi:hypothetical protein